MGTKFRILNALPVVVSCFLLLLAVNECMPLRHYVIVSLVLEVIALNQLAEDGRRRKR